MKRLKSASLFVLLSAIGGCSTDHVYHERQDRVVYDRPRVDVYERSRPAETARVETDVRYNDTRRYDDRGYNDNRVAYNDTRFNNETYYADQADVLVEVPDYDTEEDVQYFRDDLAHLVASIGECAASLAA